MTRPALFLSIVLGVLGHRAYAVPVMRQEDDGRFTVTGVILVAFDARDNMVTVEARA